MISFLNRHPFRLAVLSVVSLGAAAVAHGQVPTVDYLQHIKPLLAEKCASCHGALRQEAGLRLDAGILIRQGSDYGPVAVPDTPAESPLLERVSTSDVDLRMPPPGEGEPLTKEQLGLLSAWIQAGLPFPDDEVIPAGPEQHWAYQPPQQISLADSNGTAAGRNPIDQIVSAQLETAGIAALPPADRLTQLRRVYLDLLGLPPTRQQQQEFLTDTSPDAWAKLVDRLLDDPGYGERWGRHWMDVWRYSDWDGYKDELRGSQRHIWRWRDWIIDSLNQDRGYDRMVTEMLAADELAPADFQAVAATGFLARNFHKSNRDIWLDATVEHTAKAFLGMTVACARCHDHKYDPISQTEYYAFRAIFEPHHVRTERVPGEPDLKRNGLPRAYDAEPQAPTYLYIAGNEKQPDKENPIAPSAPAIIAIPYTPEPVDLPPVAVFPALRDFIQQEDIAAARKRLKQLQSGLESQQTASASQQDSEQPAANPDLLSDQARQELDDGWGSVWPSDADVLSQQILATEAELASLQARWAADLARYAGGAEQPSAADQTQNLARQAAQAETAAQHARTVAAVLEAKQKLAVAVTGAVDDDAGKAKKAVEEARAAYQQAAKAARKADSDQKASAESVKYTSVADHYPATSTGRRLALARWITDRQNPLTARVAVNYIWMRHFGEPLVQNVFDFGLRTPAPVQQPLLDWLAVELMQNQWSMKHVHRLIVTSDVYRRASSAAPATMQACLDADPENSLLWRAEVRRLDAESVRDSVLHIAGSLDRTAGGPDIDYGKGETVLRRSVYFRHAYEKQMTMLVLFDAAAPTECYRRSHSIIPQQALTLANSPLVVDQARLLAATLTAEVRQGAHLPASTAGDELRQEQESGLFVQAAFYTVLGRDCDPRERAACLRFLQTQTEQLTRQNELTTLPGTATATVPPSAEAAQRARENLIHVLFNHNDFVTVR